MHNRLLAFLTDIENAMAADDPAPSEGSWCNTRTVNYNLGLSRMLIAVKLPDGKIEPRGSIQLQSFHLADGSICLKAQLCWHGQTPKANVAIYAKPGTNWGSEARKVAAEWMAGAPAMAETISMEGTSVATGSSSVAAM